VRSGALLLALGVIVAITSAASQTVVESDQRTLRIIVVESVTEAQRVRARLLDGDSFPVVAEQVSVDPSADRGGLLGRLDLSSLRPELRQAVQTLAVDQISEIVPVATGFAIVKVVGDEEADTGALTAGTNRAVAATGSVKPTLEVSGFAVAIVALEEYAKPEGWNQDPRVICDVRTKSLAAAEEDVLRSLARFDQQHPDMPSTEALQLEYMLGQLYAYHGRMAEAIARFARVRERAAKIQPSLLPQLDEVLGVAYLHKAALDNRVFHAPGERCLLSPTGLHAVDQPADAAKAVDRFLASLAGKPGELEVQWLLNLASMMRGGHPDGIPAALRLPADALRSDETIPRFVDVAEQAGVHSFASAGGVIVDDFDNDGRFDLVTTNSQACGPMRFFHRGEDGMFADRSAQAGLGDQLGGLNAVQADYNNDGFLDILVLRGGWDTAQRKSLLRNNGDGTFTDVTDASGLARPATSTQTAVWADINNDGFVDLFVGNEDTPAQLFINRRDGTFEDRASSAGVAQTAFTKGVTAGDFDEDGWPDLYVSNLGGSNALYRNNRDGTFTNVARAAGVLGPGQGFATWFFDYDNDGHLDLFVTSYFKSVDEVVRTYLGLAHNASPLKLYRNLGNGQFADVTREAGLNKVYMPMGANFGDIDNDGFLDIYLGSGNPSYASIVGSVLLRNRNGTLFANVTTSSRTGELHKGHGVAFADLDNDGDEEIAFEVGGATPGDAHAFRLFENPGNSNTWINLRLVGVTSNRAAIGARIAVTVESADGMRRTIHRTVGSGGSFGASPLQQHIGLGPAARIVAIETWWPASNTRQRFSNVALNQTLEITERAAEPKSLPRPLARLGAQTGRTNAR
jgi:VCBS repeat protein/ASPIC/UnbV protein/PPIC-type peptidyl-prolyl cis-trans isomerase-like protein